MHPSRRSFVKTGIYAGLTPAIFYPLSSFAEATPDTNQQTLTSSEWNTLEAISGRIIPTDDTPGATEARCVNFIDTMLANDKGLLSFYRAVLKEIHQCCFSQHRRSFDQLNISLQDAFITSLQNGYINGWEQSAIVPKVVFDTIWAHTIMGFLADPKYGGNFNYAGWKLTGFPGHIHLLGFVSANQMQGNSKIPTVWGEMI
ncbi:MAG: gluconate 2-dehydrogenase subunit 3 family protein [Gammaproteobacteria bacterium]|nr:gluconate 2-dehydrogenase subunit 3 family protein [Gammaproteobacteria bacterium]